MVPLRDAYGIPENGEQRTENRAPLRGDGRGCGRTVECLPCGADMKDTKDTKNLG